MAKRCNFLDDCLHCRRCRRSPDGRWIGCMADKLERNDFPVPIAIGFIKSKWTRDRVKDILLMHPEDITGPVNCRSHKAAPRGARIEDMPLSRESREQYASTSRTPAPTYYESACSSNPFDIDDASSNASSSTTSTRASISLSSYLSATDGDVSDLQTTPIPRTPLRSRFCAGNPDNGDQSGSGIFQTRRKTRG